MLKEVVAIEKNYKNMTPLQKGRENFFIFRLSKSKQFLNIPQYFAARGSRKGQVRVLPNCQEPQIRGQLEQGRD